MNTFTSQKEKKFEVMVTAMELIFTILQKGHNSNEVQLEKEFYGIHNHELLFDNERTIQH